MDQALKQKWIDSSFTTERLGELAESINYCGCHVGSTRDSLATFMAIHTGEPASYEEDEKAWAKIHAEEVMP